MTLPTADPDNSTTATSQILATVLKLVREQFSLSQKSWVL
jgi:hypothetical protein